MKKILLIITGSVAAYKSMDLIRCLKKKSYDVNCVLTKSACEFITPLLASSLSGNKTYTDLFSHETEVEMGHINLSRQADLIVVAPATADFIAKMANGYGDDLASNVILAANKKIIIAPAMNEKMWQNQATQTNLTALLESGIAIVEPEVDILACGEYGVGKMNAPEKICEKIDDFFTNQNLLQGKKILITGGSTIEPIDPVRFIGNHSSGKQAIAIAKTLDEMGADVTFIAGNIRETIPLKKEKIIIVKTAEEMFFAVKNNLSQNQVFISCAAVADFKVKNIADEKIKKSDQNLTIELEKNPDILEFVGTSSNRPALVIGFAAESENLIVNARKKLQKKNCDLIVANDIEGGKIFGSNQTKAYFVSKNDIDDFGVISKQELADRIGNFIRNMF
jgi:phosphopantothenoylcysteine decarboxylase/phosphopantothenate--cysteine ligase